MKKTFVIQVEYPDCDFVTSDEIMEVTQECIDQYLEKYFGANIMDRDYDRIKVREVTDFLSLVKRMRKAQIMYRDAKDFGRPDKITVTYQVEARDLEEEVDEYLKKIDK